MTFWPFRVCPTRKSGILIATAFLVVIGILRTHHNLIYLVFAILCVCGIIGWITPTLLSRFLRLSRTAPPCGHAGSEVTVSIQMSNRSPIFSTPLVVLENPAPFGDDAVRPAVIGSLAPGSTIKFNVPVRLPRRGQLKLENPRLITAYPMGIFEREWTIDDGAEILVYPRVVSIRDRLLEGMAVNMSKLSSAPDTEREVQGLRAYQDGDDLRRVNWKASARRDNLIVGEYHKVEKRAKISLYLDLSGGNDELRETAISMVASLALFYHARNRLIELVTAREVITFSRSERKMKAMLHLLALLDEEDHIPLTRRPRESGSSMKIMIHSGRVPRGAHGCDLLIGPLDFDRYAPALGRSKAGKRRSLRDSEEDQAHA